MTKYYPMVDDCLCLLSYVSKHRGEWQTLLGLAEQTGIPRKNLSEIIKEAALDKYESLLWGVARRYGYDFCILNGAGRIIDVECRGCLAYKYIDL